MIVLSHFTRTISITFFLGIIIPVITAQENFQPGIIIDHQGDSLKGFIDYRNWSINPKYIGFKNAEEGESSRFSPLDIRAFLVQNEKYVSGIVELETTSTKDNQLRKDPAMHLRLDTIFLQALYEGDKSLYFYRNADGRENFYFASDSGFRLLEQKKYLREQQGSLIATENKKYLGQLIVYLEDCPDIRTKLAGTAYNQRSLDRVYQYYYNCAELTPGFYRSRDKMRLEWGVMAGTSLTYLKFSGKINENLRNAEFDPSFNFSGGLFADLIMPRNRGKWSLNNELQYAAYKVSAYYYMYQNPDYYSDNTWTFGYRYIKYNSMLRYRFLLRRGILYANLGISYGYQITEINNKKIDYVMYSSEGTKEVPILGVTRKFENGSILGMGIQHKKISFELRYERGNGISYYKNLVSTTNRFYALFAYRI